MANLAQYLGAGLLSCVGTWIQHGFRLSLATSVVAAAAAAAAAAATAAFTATGWAASMFFETCGCINPEKPWLSCA
jgi:hypothetical protein